jgi:TPP-dependent pyruvate/acetoin dehydrogenase alpha subunit
MAGEKTDEPALAEADPEASPTPAPPTAAVEAAAGDGPRLLERYRTMRRIRAFEEAVGRRFRDGDIHGFVHTSIGQEAAATGACAALRDGDYLTTTHRGHGHCLAKGADPTAMMAELFGRETGSCRGRGGSMHLAQAELGILGANGIVGAGIPIAVGAALAARAAGRGAVAMAFFGEGAVHSGAFHEGVGLAVAWQVPVVFACENNHYAEFTPSAGSWNGPGLVDRASSYGVEAVSVDGNDVFAVESELARLVERARAGGGPAFVELRTYRMGGHYEGDATPYRLEEEVQRWRAADPIGRARATLERLGEGARTGAIDAEAEAEIARAVEAALAAPYPDPDSVLEHVRA